MKNLFLFLILILFSILAGCGTADRFEAKFTGYATNCVNGVEYIQFASGASVAYNTDGTIKLCK